MTITWRLPTNAPWAHAYDGTRVVSRRDIETTTPQYKALCRFWPATADDQTPRIDPADRDTTRCPDCVRESLAVQLLTLTRLATTLADEVVAIQRQDGWPIDCGWGRLFEAARALDEHLGITEVRV